jgi:hypothetical protein
MKSTMPKFPTALLRRLLLLSVFVLAGCRFTREAPAPPLPLSQKVRWSGNLASGYSDSLIAPGDSLNWGNAFRIHDFTFSDPDSTRLRLFEFAHPYGAYAAYQRVSDLEGIVEGHFHDGPVWRFHHDRYSGELTSRLDNARGDELIENLTLQGEPLFLKPKEFESFPLLGRIPHSERIIAEHFLGRDWHGPVFTVAYRCHDDTATAFRAFAQEDKMLEGWLGAWKGQTDSLDWGREIHFKGEDEFHRPLIFWKFPEAVMGFAGCFDTILALEYAEKMKKTAILWPKP